MNLSHLESMIDFMVEEGLALTEIISVGELIGRLNAMPDENIVKVEFLDSLYNPGDVDSYRGFYNHLFINYTEKDERTVEQVLKNLRDAIGTTFQGYKGGYYEMDWKTPIWVDEYGRAQEVGVTGVERNGDIVIITSAKCSIY